jgi:hypothetical protein
MEKVTYEKEITALIVIDPYNDFISKRDCKEKGDCNESR